MSSSAAALSAAKANLVSALQSLFGDPVLVSYGVSQDLPDDLIEVLDVTSVEAEGPFSPLRRRDHSFTVNGIISCYRGGGAEVQQTVTERALSMLASLADYLQDSGTSNSTHVSLGNSVVWARLTSWTLHEADGDSEDEDVTNGRTTAIEFTISGLIRA